MFKVSTYEPVIAKSTSRKQSRTSIAAFLPVAHDDLQRSYTRSYESLFGEEGLLTSNILCVDDR
jgi:hypothetical protein